jgi:acyl-CoA synthetase (AMP-forming)/AMP-acid ligase II
LTDSETAEPAALRHDWIEVPTLGDLVVRRAAVGPGTDALVFPWRRESGAGLLASSVDAARSLLGLGIAPGETVGILMPNHPDFLHVLYGCALIGARALLVNARYKAFELAYLLENADAAAVVTTDVVSEYVDFVPLLDEATAGRPPLLRHLVLLGDSSPSGYVDRAGFEAAAAGVGADAVHRLRESVRVRDVALLLYTSGTTARPKGCLISHEALVRTAISVAGRFRLTAEDRFWDPLPFFHMAGLLQLTATLHAGGAFVTMGRFEPASALRQIEAERCTFLFPCFPTITQSLIHHPDFASTDLSAVRGLLDTGPAESLRAVERAFGVPVVTSYGLTEAGGVVAFGHLDDPIEQRSTTGGRPFRGMDLRVVDAESGADLPAGETGRILVRGPGLFDGYHKDPELTAVATAGGWLDTGDLGRLDEQGRISYGGRWKDMLKVGGENVSALEIEAFLGGHPAVKVVAVVGVPDAKYVEVPAAFVERVPGADLGEEELIAHCRGRIASFKVPRHVRFVEEWPMSATKIQKHRLRESLLSELGLGGPG